jgi:hypothetical protein
MSQATQVSLGPSKAPGFIMPILNNLALTTVISSLTGTVRIPLFASTVDGSNGFSGTFVGVKTVARAATPGTITVKNNENGTVTSITLPVHGIQGSMNGSASNVAFTLNGCSTVEASAAGVDATVEILFTVAEVK